MNNPLQCTDATSRENIVLSWDGWPMHTNRIQKELWRQKAKSAMQAKAESGVLPGCAPVGYINVRRGKELVIEPDYLKCHLVAYLFQLVSEGKSIREAGRIVGRFGLKSRNGKVLGPSAMYAILTNPFYMGMLRYKGELIQGKHRAIVSVRVFDAVSERLKRTKYRQNRNSMIL